MASEKSSAFSCTVEQLEAGMGRENRELVEASAFEALRAAAHGYHTRTTLLGESANCGAASVTLREAAMAWTDAYRRRER